jgi:chorismate dehydratase
MLRIGAVSYLNTKPLIHGLNERLGERGRLTLALPSQLADDLRGGQLDVALIPSVEYFRGTGDPNFEYRIISNAAIGCRGPVWSVRLLSRVPTRQIKRLALDEGSRTSAAMVRILLSEMHGIQPETVPFPMNTEAESVDADAVLMIGDRAMHPERGVYREIWDLGDRWCRHTELPFVFAMWVARIKKPAVSPSSEPFESSDRLSVNHHELSELTQVLESSRDDGLENFEWIAKNESAAHGLTAEDLHRYFAENLHFTLGPGERLGLKTFQEKCQSLGLAPQTKSSLPEFI